MLGNLAAKENSFIFFAVSKRPQFAHAPFTHHVAGDVRGALDIIAGARGDVAEENFFSRATAHQDGEHAFEIFSRVGVLVGFRQLHG